MPLIVLIILLILIIAAYKLLVQGILWRAILLVAGPIAIWMVLSIRVPESNATALTLGSTTISWAALLPMALVFLVLLTTRSEE